MTKRLRAVAALAVVALTAACHTRRASLSDVVLIAVDTLRSDPLSSDGHPAETAPTLSRLAREGVVFERTVSASSFTKTSVASLRTSRDPDRHGVRDDDDAQPPQLEAAEEAP